MPIRVSLTGIDTIASFHSRQPAATHQTHQRRSAQSDGADIQVDLIVSRALLPAALCSAAGSPPIATLPDVLLHCAGNHLCRIIALWSPFGIQQRIAESRRGK